MNLAPLIFVLLVLGLMLRIVPMRRVGRFLLGLIFIPILVSIGWSMMRGLWSAASLIERIGIMLCVPIVVFVAFMAILPAGVREYLMASFLYDAFRGAARSGTRLAGMIFSRGGNRRR